jgi:hypothetical protein
MKVPEDLLVSVQIWVFRCEPLLATDHQQRTRPERSEKIFFVQIERSDVRCKRDGCDGWWPPMATVSGVEQIEASSQLARQFRNWRDHYISH